MKEGAPRRSTRRTVTGVAAGGLALVAVGWTASSSERYNTTGDYDINRDKPGGVYSVSHERTTIWGIVPQCFPNDIPNPGIKDFENTITADLVEGTCTVIKVPKNK